MTLQNGDDKDKLPPKSFFKHAHNAKSFSYVIFGSENVMDTIKQRIPVERIKILLDATFKVCPYGPFNQLLIIHIEHLNEVCVFIFLVSNIDVILMSETNFFRLHRFYSF